MPTKDKKYFFATKKGAAYLADSKEYLKNEKSKKYNLIVTSPPFGLVRKKDYGNVDSDKYVRWFQEFGEQFFRTLKDDGSLVIDIGGAWIPGQPTRSLYHYELLIMLCKEIGFHLAQDFFWWNPSKLPTPAEWVTVRRVRVKDSINCIWWLSKTPYPKANNKRVTAPYSDSMLDLMKNGYVPKKRPSGHNISAKFGKNNGGAIPPNLITLPNTESNSRYLTECKKHNIAAHPARFPSELPEYFIRMLTDKGDLVLDPFAGSCATGEAAERLSRKWVCIDTDKNYLQGAQLRFPIDTKKLRNYTQKYYANHPGALWNTELDGINEELKTGKTRSE